ncbi:MAG: bifunctional homocysteine S-methyltransferase/methylenetetrahydrofolate reductase [Lentisphaerae bacterium GWF2_44_16]|nr:MAG: bifunctional homocysteine S-methyltransferase/methylenetetrahydrofolate reductase [Lentisphaerae bacterium GWF2_44_16]
MSDKLKEKLCNQIVIFDGAMGTEIYKRNFFVNISFESLCVSSPKIISEIHKSYYDAGAEVLTTNSYNANFNKLSYYGLSDKVKEINTAAVKLAKESGGTDTLIAGSVGPIGDISYNSGITDERIVEILTEHIQALQDAGADFIIFETTSSLIDTEYAFRAINNGPSLPYVISFSLDRNCETAKGEPVAKLLQVLNGNGRKPTALGLNCGEGAEGMLASLEKFIPLVDYPVIAQPNAGIPKNVDNRMLYMTNPEYLTTYAKRYVDLGARAVGGCCGTGPDHIKDIARSIKPLGKSEFSSKLRIIEHDVPLKEPMPTASKSKFGKKLASGEWITSVEILPPHGYMLKQTIEKAILCKNAGVDAINIPDGPRASSRISPLVTALQIQREADIETVLHFCCRDKNLIGMQADILGCSCLGLNNVLFITGDPPKLGDYPFASAVFDVDSIGMVKIQDRLNRGVDLGGKPIDPPTAILIGVGADPNAIDMERELRRTREKVEAGAEFIITQPVFAVEPLLAFLDKISYLKTPVIAGIFPLASFRNAEFMKNEVPGVVVPDEIMKRMAGAETKEAQRQEGIKIARESIEKIKDGIQGIQVSAPLGNVSTAIEVIKSK